MLLKQQLHACFSKVSKTQKLEEEVANIYCVHEELKQTCERREKLERAARLRLQSDLNRVQELNRVMKDQMDILQSQLLAPSEHQLLIAQLFTQSKCGHENRSVLVFKRYHFVDFALQTKI